jgi:hypothetical protein
MGILGFKINRVSYRLDLSVSGYRPVAGSCELGNESSGSLLVVNFLTT